VGNALWLLTPTRVATAVASESTGAIKSKVIYRRADPPPIINQSPSIERAFPRKSDDDAASVTLPDTSGTPSHRRRIVYRVRPIVALERDNSFPALRFRRSIRCRKISRSTAGDVRFR